MIRESGERENEMKSKSYSDLTILTNIIRPKFSVYLFVKESNQRSFLENGVKKNYCNSPLPPPLLRLLING